MNLSHTNLFETHLLSAVPVSNHPLFQPWDPLCLSVAQCLWPQSTADRFANHCTGPKHLGLSNEWTQSWRIGFKSTAFKSKSRKEPKKRKHLLLSSKMSIQTITKRHECNFGSLKEVRILTFSDLEIECFFTGLGPSLPLVADQSYPNLIQDLSSQGPALLVKFQRLTSSEGKCMGQRLSRWLWIWDDKYNTSNWDRILLDGLCIYLFIWHSNSCAAAGGSAAGRTARSPWPPSLGLLSPCFLLLLLCLWPFPNPASASLASFLVTLVLLSWLVFFPAGMV